MLSPGLHLHYLGELSSKVSLQGLPLLSHMDETQEGKRSLPTCLNWHSCHRVYILISGARKPNGFRILRLITRKTVTLKNRYLFLNSSLKFHQTMSPGLSEMPCSALKPLKTLLWLLPADTDAAFLSEFRSEE